MKCTPTTDTVTVKAGRQRLMQMVSRSEQVRYEAFCSSAIEGVRLMEGWLNGHHGSWHNYYWRWAR